MKMCNLYEQIQQACKKAGLTVSAMCLALGMSKSTMSDLKSGRKKTLSSDTIAKIAEFLNVTTDELIFGREYKEEPNTENAVAIPILYNRIEELCAKQGVSAYRLCKDIGIRGSVLSDLRTGRKQGLSSKTLTLIAEYFGVSIDYLLGKEEAATPKDDRSAKEAQAMELFSRLSPEEQEIVLAQLRGLTDGR
jgi:transcriptional regulator with XRE-family HTH domain